MNTQSIRPWATKLTTGAFILMAGTGVVMFFKRDLGLTSVVHQWFSWIFLVGVGAHITINFRPLKNHIQARPGAYSVAFFTALLIASFFSWGMITGPKLLEPVEQSLIHAPLSVLASLTETTPPKLLQRLNAFGVSGAADQSIEELSSKSGLSEDRLLAFVFLNK